MIIRSETRLREFEFWSGGSDTANCLTWGQLEEIEDILTDIYPDGMDDTTINDLFWFDDELLAEWLGYSSFEDLVNEPVSCEDEGQKAA